MTEEEGFLLEAAIEFSDRLDEDADGETVYVISEAKMLELLIRVRDAGRRQGKQQGKPQ